MPTTIEASRQLVLDRLGAPTPQLPGAHYRHRSPRLPRIYERYGQYVDAWLMEDSPEQALESFIAFLEREREHDYTAFHYGRELLLVDLSIYIDSPSDDPEPGSSPASPAVARELPRWSRRKPARAKREQLRARVLEQLGRPHGRLPGEALMLTSNPALDEVIAYLDDLELQAVTEQVVDEAIERIGALRERDWQAFCYGRSGLLRRLPIELELPTPVGADQALAATG